MLCRWCNQPRADKSQSPWAKQPDRRAAQQRKGQKQQREVREGSPPPPQGVWAKQPDSEPEEGEGGEPSIGDRISALAKQVQQLRKWNIPEEVVAEKEAEIKKLQAERDANKPLSVLLRQAETRQHKAEAKQEKQREQLEGIRTKMDKLREEEAAAQQQLADAAREVEEAKKEAAALKAERPPESESQKAAEALKLLGTVASLCCGWTQATEHLRPLQAACAAEKERLEAAEAAAQVEEGGKEEAKAKGDGRTDPTKRSTADDMDWRGMAEKWYAEAKGVSADDAKKAIAADLAAAAAASSNEGQPSKAPRTG